jgi:phospholipid/cholesterol/gamma-HCH transport system substrate-binding protein
VKRAISKNLKEFVAIIALALIAAFVGGYILTKQRLTLPGWVPGVGTEFTEYKAAMSTAQAVTPGQGQTVQIAGVDVGELTKVDLVDGRAIVSMKVDPDHPFYRDASAMLRPKTGLNDMVLQVDPGTRAAGEAADGFTIPIDKTLPNVNFDQFLSALDGDTRDSLQLLLGSVGQAVKGQGRQLSNTLRRFEPLGRDVARLNRELSTRTRHIKRSVRNFRLLAEELGSKDDELAAFVDANNAVFRSFANQDARLRETLRELPTALRKTNSALAKVEPLGTELGQTLGGLRGFARDLGPALRATRPFLRETTPIIRTQLRPFARDAQPVAKLVRSGSAGLTEVTPNLSTSLNVVNYLANGLAYNPKGPEEGYLFWFAWAAHLGNSIFNMQDAHGGVRRGAIVASCDALTSANALAGTTGPLAVLATLSDTPKPSEVNCTPVEEE